LTNATVGKMINIKMEHTKATLMCLKNISKLWCSSTIWIYRCKNYRYVWREWWWTKELNINNHKNDRQGPKVIDIKDKQSRRTLGQGLNKYLISNSKNKHYKDNSALTKLFSKTFTKYTPYDLRKCLSSKAIHEGDTEKINMLERNQGHSLETIFL